MGNDGKDIAKQFSLAADKLPTQEETIATMEKENIEEKGKKKSCRNVLGRHTAEIMPLSAQIIGN